ncbi:MAG: tRNA uridine-5-carboxymethylaminomethyl(34) synthesis enzyme MnmG [Clostridiales bacterium]|nr:tRNA uridine-5-carboxymethylaminomethyl(34) synthesis enzyme MnmG [Clostridiales bacterium]MBQ1571708.1 tRNA uridine-5-carboxymethylaminomethyl(34) synthesis enzyme MnmG [Clostridiales bacterium]
MTIREALELERSFEAGTFDVAVVGAGHAGCEAAHACAKLGLDTILFTLSLDSLANLPCNPSIGGTSKGQLVREIDALGGIMGIMADKCAVQMRMLNRSKGPAVYSPRAQEDRAMYSVEMKHYLENLPNLTLKQAHITGLLVDEEGKAAGVMTEGKAIYRARAVVICSGTYMEARIIRGEVIVESGPDGLPRSVGLSSSLNSLGVPLLRFKTGTPVRVNSNSIDFSQMTRQDGEDDIPPFSYRNEMEGKLPAPSEEQIPCWSIWTTEETRKVIADNMDRSPLYSGEIKGIGPRYCPSIEDKFMRFKDKTRHQIFVEPMGRHTNEMYLQGFSTSLPEEIQEKMVKSLPGLSNAKIQRAAYAIEYDLVDPLSIKASLESKVVPGLFTAGQINGSSGYEEAAAQGIVAGINAAMGCLGKDAVIIDRSQGYIGVLIDDLVTKGTNEPYRMMTSRAEYRLFLRQDNADERLTPIGHEIGLISDEVFEKFKKKVEAIAEETERLKKTYVAPTDELKVLLESVNQTLPKSGESLADLIKRPDVTYDLLAPVDKKRKPLPRNVTFACETNIKYEGYLSLEKEKIEKFKNLEKIRIPEDIDYSLIKGLRIEATQKLSKMKPESVGRASRISGVSPADCEVLLVYLEQLRRRHDNG